MSRAADLLPFEAGPFALRMGVRSLALDEWIDVDPDRLDAELALKRQLVATRHDEVVAVVDGAGGDAAAELDELAAGWWLQRRHGRPAEPDADLHPVVRAALRTQEDWCVLAPVEADGPPVLIAACVCFPTRWILRDKVGLPLAAIHGPVASYDRQLASSVDRFVERLRPDRPVWRANWNLVDDAALHQGYLPDPLRRLAASAEAVADHVYLRVERQTLRRLPRTGAIAFGIRVHQRPVRHLADRPADLARLLDAVDALPPDTFRYKGLAAFWAPLRAWLIRSTAPGALGAAEPQNNAPWARSMPRRSS
jgi:hypothetical protein